IEPISVARIGSGEIGTGQGSSVKKCFGQVSAAEIGAVEQRAGKISPRHILVREGGGVERATAQADAPQIVRGITGCRINLRKSQSADAGGVLVEVRKGNRGAAEIGGGKVGAGEISAAQVGLAQIRAAKHSAAGSHRGKVGVMKVSAGE